MCERRGTSHEQHDDDDDDDVGGTVCEGQRGSKRMSATSQQPRSPSIAACLLARGEREMYCWSASIKDYSRKVMNRRDGWPDR